MKSILAVTLLAVPLLLTATAASACNGRQLEDDLRWCLAGREGRGDIAGGAFAKDAHQLEDGWNACEQSDTANKNFDQCSAGQKIDTARAILGYNNLKILTPGARRSGALTRPQIAR